jgi:hypothetical protein
VTPASVRITTDHEDSLVTCLVAIISVSRNVRKFSSSRARAETQLHIDASETAAALERTELGGADLRETPDRARVLARARAQKPSRLRNRVEQGRRSAGCGSRLDA